MKFIAFVILLFMLTSFTVTSSFASNDKKEIQQRVAAMSEEQKETRAAEMKIRVEQIQQMDKSRLSSEQRKALRLELRHMSIEAKAMDKDGFYISFAGIVVIIFVLIIVL